MSNSESKRRPRRPRPDPVSELLSVEEVARVLGNVELSGETASRLRKVVRGDPRLAVPVAGLEAMARDAGLDPAAAEDLWDGFRAHQVFDRLLAAEDWQHPAEVVDAEGELEPYFRELIQMAEARARRADDSGRVLAVREKLERAWAEEQAKAALVEGFATGLCGYRREVSEQLLRRAATEYRLRSRQTEARS